ncbi:hypothetical protein ACC715_37170, partial [Rhizobium ruizarguesonis]
VATQVSNAQMLGWAIAVDAGADEDVIEAHRITSPEIIFRCEQLRLRRGQVTDFSLVANCLPGIADLAVLVENLEIGGRRLPI